MPLPTAPSQRASFLSTQDYGSPAKESAKPVPKKPRADDFEGVGFVGQASDSKAPPMAKASQHAEILEKTDERQRQKVAPRYASASNSSPSALTQAPVYAAAHSDFDSKPTAKESYAQPLKANQAVQTARTAQVNTNAAALNQPAATPTVAPAAKPKKAKSTGPTKLFVLDTNVLMHDPMSLFRFEEHDIFLPMIVLEELDGHKKGMTEVARNARQVSRTLDALAAVQGADMTQGLKLDATGHRGVHGRLFFQTQPLNYTLPISLPQGKADNQILGVVGALGEMHKAREVVLVSKDINMRVKARALGLPTDDYQNDKTLEDGDLLYTGSLMLPHNFWDTHGKGMESWQQNGNTFYRISGPVVPNLLINQFVYLEAPGEPALYARVSEIRGKTAVLRTLKDYNHNKNAVWGVTTRNREQNFAMNILMDPEVDLVTLAGTAGSGKTLMALAAGLTQVLDDRRYTEIIMTRATVSVGEDIGFLPGTEEEKMGPWMGALDDNLEFLTKNDSSGHGSSGSGEWGRAATNELVRSKIKIKSMNFMRGRTFLNKYVIIDEAQNLTPKQMKTLITRAGPGTKIVCMGNLAQIDTPYLTEGSSGMTFAVDKFKGWPHGGHITLARGERSRLADFASEVL